MEDFNQSSKKGTLVIVCGSLSQGGAERIISVLVDKWIKYFESVEIVTWVEAPIFYHFDSNIKITSIPIESSTTSRFSQLFWFRKYIKKRDPYAVLSFLAPFNMLTLLGLLGTHYRILIAERSDPAHDCPNEFWRKVRNSFYFLADGLCVQTENSRQYFSFSIRKKTEVIFNPSFITQEMIGKALHASKQKLIVSVGRLSKAKNQKLLLEAFRRVHDCKPDYKLVIYGEGEERCALEEQIKELSLENVVQLPGSRKNVHSLILHAELFVMSSKYEGMPNALIEAMCLGLPCISTRVSGATELIYHSINGMLVTNNDCDALTNAMLYMLNNREEANTMAVEATKVAQKLDMNTIVQQWVNFIIQGVEKE